MLGTFGKKHFNATVSSLRGALQRETSFWKRDLISDPIVSDFFAVLAIGLFVLGIVLSILTSPTGEVTIVPYWTGLLALSLVACGTAYWLLQPPSLPQERRSSSLAFRVLGFPLRALDAVLVRYVAQTLLSSIRSSVWRIIALTVALLLFGLGAASLSGLVALMFAILGWAVCIGAVRLWAWQQHDRASFFLPGRNIDETYRLYGNFREDDWETLEPFRVGFDRDYSKTAILGAFFSVVFAAIILKEIDDVFAVFRTSANVDYLSWFGFTSVELLKAIPVLDWSDIFGFSNSSDVSAISEAAKLIVFGLRTSFDFLALGMLIEYFAVQRTISAHNSAFMQDSNVQMLEPVSEKLYLRKFRNRFFDLLVRSGPEFDEKWHDFDHHRLYNLNRLAFLISMPKFDEDLRIAAVAVAAVASRSDGRYDRTTTLVKVRPIVSQERVGLFLAIALLTIAEDEIDVTVTAGGFLNETFVDDEVRKGAGQLLSSDGYRLKRTGLILAGKLGLKEHSSLILKLTADADSSIREWAIDALGRVEFLVEQAHWAPWLTDEADTIRSAAVHYIGILKIQEAVTLLIPMIEDSSSNVRRNVANTLYILDRAEGMAAVLKLVTRRDADLMKSVAHFFAHAPIDGDEYEQIFAIWETYDTTQKVMLIPALVRVDAPKKCSEFIQRVLHSNEPKELKEAIKDLQNTATDQAARRE